MTWRFKWNYRKSAINQVRLTAIDNYDVNYVGFKITNQTIPVTQRYKSWLCVVDLDVKLCENRL